MTNHVGGPLDNLASKIESQGMTGGMDGAFHAQTEALTDLALASQLGKANALDMTNPQVASMLDSGPGGFHLFDSSQANSAQPDSAAAINPDTSATGAVGDIMKTVMGGFGSLGADPAYNPWLPSQQTPDSYDDQSA